MATAKRILSNTFVQVFGRAFMAFTGILVLKMLTHYMDLKAYGYYAGIYEFLAFFGIVADFGLFTIGVREMSQQKHSKEFVMGNILGMRLLLAAVTMVVAILVAFSWPKFSGTPIPLGVAIASIGVFLTIVQGTISSVLQVELKMAYSTIAMVTGKLFSVLWTVLVIYYFFKGDPGEAAFYQLVWGGTVGALLTLIITYFYAAKHVKIRPLLNKAYWEDVFRNALPYGLALVLSMIYFRIDTMMVFSMRSPEEMALYSPALRIMEILSVIPIYFMNSMLPGLSHGVQHDLEKAKSEAAHAFDFLFLLGLPMSLGLALLAYPVTALLTEPEFLSRLSDGFYGADQAMELLAFALFFVFLNNLFSYLLIVLGRQASLLWINGLAAVFNVVFNFFVIPVYGFRGAAFSSILTEGVVLVLAYLAMRRHFKFEFHWRILSGGVVAGTLMGLGLYFLRTSAMEFMGFGSVNVLWFSALGGLFYGVLLLIFGVLPKNFLGFFWKRG